MEELFGSIDIHKKRDAIDEPSTSGHPISTFNEHILEKSGKLTVSLLCPQDGRRALSGSAIRTELKCLNCNKSFCAFVKRYYFFCISLCKINYFIILLYIYLLYYICTYFLIYIMVILVTELLKRLLYIYIYCDIFYEPNYFFSLLSHCAIEEVLVYILFIL